MSTTTWNDTAGLSFRQVEATELPRVHSLEMDGFSVDEAAPFASLELRQRLAPELFLGTYQTSPSQSEPLLVGYICATLTPSSTFTHASMSTHVPGASYAAIHSVCVDRDYRGKGVAHALLKEYLARLEKMEGVKGTRLITHDVLIDFYLSAGFMMAGVSEVVHGPAAWYEMVVDFKKAVEVAFEVRSPGVTFDSVGQSMDALVDAAGMNAGDLYCPRGECRCLLLRKGVGRWVSSRPDQDVFDLPPLPFLIASTQSTPADSSTSQGYWSIPSPLAFENIGFSRNTAPLPSTNTASSVSIPSGTIKYLICADCDQGPLGWHDTEGRDLGIEVELENEGNVSGKVATGGGEVRKGREFLLDVARVRYRLN